jgi:arylsulfatase A
MTNGQYTPTKPDDYGPDLFNQFTIGFFEKHKDKPFVMYCPMVLTHGPHDPTPDLSSPGKKTEKGFKSNVEYMDAKVGELVAALERLKLRDNTIIFFMGDNGTAGDGKGAATELGVRVPLIVNGPGVVKSGVVSDGLVDLSDILPTLADFAGAPLPNDRAIDGRSFAATLRGESGMPREWIFSYLGPERVLRDQRWLLEGDGKFYDCGDQRDGEGYRDVTESKDAEVIAARAKFAKILEKMPAPAGEANDRGGRRARRRANRPAE